MEYARGLAAGFMEYARQYGTIAMFGGQRPEATDGKVEARRHTHSTALTRTQRCATSAAVTTTVQAASCVGKVGRIERRRRHDR